MTTISPKGMKILIADDHTIVRRGLKQLLLEEYPFAILGEVGDAEALIETVTLQNWDILLCDINMPGRSGIDALQQIKQSVPSLPVLIMSMYPEEQYALRVFKAGAAGYLSKETIHLDLINAIEKVIAGKKFITPSIAEKLFDSLDVKTQKPLHETLSNREYEVFMSLVSGKSSAAIADKLSISSTTVSTYRIRILEKMKMDSNTELIKYAIEFKLI
jgi:two-component system, NarL family, invasion response regulator UvrY